MVQGVRMEGAEDKAVAFVSKNKGSSYPGRMGTQGSDIISQTLHSCM